jgi:hypothetical protein
MKKYLAAARDMALPFLNALIDDLLAKRDDPTNRVSPAQAEYRRFYLRPHVAGTL